MFNLTRSVRLVGASNRLFSSSVSRNYDVAKLTLVGRLGQEPESKFTASNKEYVTYSVATTNYPPPPPNPDGSRPMARTSWHRVFCFNTNAYNYLKSLSKGSHVYVECDYELREPEHDAEEGSPQSHRQIFLRHESIRLLKGAGPRNTPEAEAESNSQN